MIRDSHKFTVYREDDEHSTTRVSPPFRWTLYFSLPEEVGTVGRHGPTSVDDPFLVLPPGTGDPLEWGCVASPSPSTYPGSRSL